MTAEPDSPGTTPPPREAASLRYIVEAEAKRVLSEAQIEADPARIADGWERRFIADGPRAAEMIALYEELGYEVVADPITPEQMDDECVDCAVLIQLAFKMIYTRTSKLPRQRDSS